MLALMLNMSKNLSTGVKVVPVFIALANVVPAVKCWLHFLVFLPPGLLNVQHLSCHSSVS